MRPTPTATLAGCPPMPDRRDDDACRGVDASKRSSVVVRQPDRAFAGSEPECPFGMERRPERDRVRNPHRLRINSHEGGMLSNVVRHARQPHRAVADGERARVDGAQGLAGRHRRLGRDPDDHLFEIGYPDRAGADGDVDQSMTAVQVAETGKDRARGWVDLQQLGPDATQTAPSPTATADAVVGGPSPRGAAASRGRLLFAGASGRACCRSRWPPRRRRNP